MPATTMAARSATAIRRVGWVDRFIASSAVCLGVGTGGIASTHTQAACHMVRSPGLVTYQSLVAAWRPCSAEETIRPCGAPATGRATGPRWCEGGYGLVHGQCARHHDPMDQAVIWEGPRR